MIMDNFICIEMAVCIFKKLMHTAFCHLRKGSMALSKMLLRYANVIP